MLTPAKRLFAVMLIALGVLAQAAFAQKAPQPGTSITVSKSSGAMFSTIQAAVNAARPGQVIEILDTAVYAEQVTIDGRAESPWSGRGVVGGKNGITIRYVPAPGVPGRPVIRWQDTLNLHPKYDIESNISGELPGQNANFETCAALRILHASGVTIEGIIVDGGSSTPFGWPNVWRGPEGATWPLTHGNAAVALVISNNVQIRDCELQNAYFGIYVKDRNESGVFSNPQPNPLDVNDASPVRLSGFGKTGNHLVEYNRIHDNAVGIFFEFLYDFGSTVRYNLIYNNYNKVRLPNDFPNINNIVAGAIMFKDSYLTPVAIYNNTFFANNYNLIGLWRIGYQHLIFNNIFDRKGGRNEDDANPGAQAYMSIMDKFPERMGNSLFVAEPSQNNIPIQNFFRSTDETSADFLVPNWERQEVQDSVRKRGWVFGVTNDDGTPADLGAIPYSGKRPCDGMAQTARARITPFDIVQLDENRATVGIYVNQEIGSLSNLTVKSLRWIGPLPDNSSYDNGGGSWASNGDAVPRSAVMSIHTLGAEVFNVGSNVVSFVIPMSQSARSYYGFFEMILQGTDDIGRHVTTDVGFLPYRPIDYEPLDIHVIGEDGNPVDTPSVTVGEPVNVRVTARGGNMSGVALDVAYKLVSDPTAKMALVGTDAALEREQWAAGTTTKTHTVYFTKTGNEVISVVGTYGTHPDSRAFLGALRLTVLPGLVAEDPDIPFDPDDIPVEPDSVVSSIPLQVAFLSPPPKASLGAGVLPPVVHGFYPVEVQVRDDYGNPVQAKVVVELASSREDYGFVSNRYAATNPATGIARFFVQALEDVPGNEVFDLTASIINNGKQVSDVASLRTREILPDEPVIVPAPRVVGGGYMADAGYIHSAKLTFNEDVSNDWFSSLAFAFGLIRGTMTNTSCLYRDSEDARSVMVAMGCAFPGAGLPEVAGSNSRITINYNAVNGWAPQTVTISDGMVSVREINRVIPPDMEDVAVVAPKATLPNALIAGPNPVRRFGPLTPAVNFYRQGSDIESLKLSIYDASGNLIKRINTSGRRSTPESRPVVATWDLRDRKDRLVSEGTYLVRGELKTLNGTRERVSLVIGVR